MANQGALTGLGNVVKAHKGFRAEINTRYREERFKITGPLQAASVFRGHESRPDHAEGNLYVHGSRSGRAEGALNVQPTCLGVQRILCTVKLPRNSTY